MSGNRAGPHRGHPASGDRLYSDEEREWVAACAAHMKRHKLKFLPHSEVLRVAKALGYRKGTGEAPAGSPPG